MTFTDFFLGLRANLNNFLSHIRFQNLDLVEVESWDLGGLRLAWERKLLNFFGHRFLKGHGLMEGIDALAIKIFGALTFLNVFVCGTYL